MSTNERTKEQKNKRTKEQKNKRTKEQKNKRTKEQKNKRTKEQKNKRTIQFKLGKEYRNLVESLKKKSYKSKATRKVEIPKENGETRPHSIYSYEDKLV